MEVLCERCQTEYDFDDALVSERGTTVKCTSCGHQFRIFRPKTSAAPPERWEVRTRRGQDFVFVSLRELQRAITRGQVDRDDVLIRAGLAPRVLSSIAELEPFFPSTVNRVPTPLPPRPESSGRKPTPPGIGGTTGESRALPFQATVPAAQVAAPPAKGLAASQTRPGLPPVTPPTPAPAPTTMVSGSAGALLVDPATFEPETTRRPGAPGGPDADGSGARQLPPVQPKPAAGRSPADKIEQPGEVVIREKPDVTYAPTPSDIRAVYAGAEEAQGDIRFVTPARKGSAAMRWVVAFVVVGAVIVAGAAVGRRFLRPSAPVPAAVATVDPRASELIKSGERKLLEGDLDGAKENFDKASALAEKDARVQVPLARWANVKADLPWLKVRLMSADQTDALALARKEAEESSARALQLSQHALELAPDDPTVVRARVDALRISGDVAGARKLLAQTPLPAAEPDTAYVLAALDMSEPNPNWDLIIDRLRNAVTGEQMLGRSRAALAFALASSGQLEPAQAEIDELLRAPRPYPLLLELKAFVARQPARKDAGLTEAGIDPSSLPLATAGPAAEVEPTHGSYQDVLARAHAARQAGDLAKAEQLYRAVLAKNPSDTEALSGLGDVAKAKGDQSGSLSYYEQVQKNNPSYLPAIIGLADAKWDSGDKQGALALYRQVLDRTGGQGPYAERARQRLAQGAAAPPATATATATATAAPSATAAPTSTPTATSTATSAPPAGADTSDLPGWKP
jgi:predicted Zn finger-like uncharacterized protein